MTARALPCAAAAVAILAGCASSAGDRLLAAGDLAGAARAYERAAHGGWLTSTEASTRALLNLGVLQATPSSPVYDPAEARRTFERVLARAAATPSALEARLMLARLAEDGSHRVADLEGRLAAALDERTALEARTRTDDPKPAEDLTADLERARRRVALLEAEVRRLEAEIAQLKALDLELDDPPVP